MKRLCAAAIAIFVVGAISCKKEQPNGAEEISLSVTPVSAEVTEDRVFEPGTFFTPDYTPYEPEPVREPGKLKLASPKTTGEKIVSIVPGLRKLSDYLTAYRTSRAEYKLPQIKPLSSDETGAKSKKSKRADEPFTVSDWGPQDAIPADVHYPSFYVLFSEPVVALTALGSQTDKSEYFSVEPAVKGVFRWNGTSLLSFDCTETVNPLQVYRIKVSDKVTSLSGKKLTGETTFTTKAAPLAIIWNAAGYSKSKWVDRDEVPPVCAQELRVQFNYPVQAEALKSMSRITFSA